MTEGSSTETNKRYGWVPYAESWNGRLAMIGLVIGIFTEVITGQSIFTQIGLG